MTPEQRRNANRPPRRRQGSADVEHRRRPRPNGTRGEEARKKSRRKRKMNEALGKVIPFLVAIVLIVAVVGIFYGGKLANKYTYSGEHADLNDYFDVFYDYEVALLVDNVKVEEKAVFYKNAYYFSLDDAKKYFTDRFYINLDEQIALFTTQDKIISAELNQSGDFHYFNGTENESLSAAPVITNDGKVYVSLEYLHMFADFKAETFSDPQRIVLYTKDKTLDKAVINKDTAVRWKGGVKSEILEDVKKGDTVYVLEEMEDWAKVQTLDGFIGYTEIKRYDKDGTTGITVDKATIVADYNSIKMPQTVNMGFYQVFEGGSDYSSVTANTKALNVIAPTWFRFVDNEGTVKSGANADFVNKAHENGVQVWAVWTDVDNDVDIGEMLKSSINRKMIIDNIISQSTNYGIDGVNLDLEKIKESAGDDWTEFLRELSIETHKAGLVLSVDNYAPTASTLHYNREEQGLVCDYVVVMGYDEHWATSEDAGSVASIGFVEDGINNTIACGVPAEKVINAIPFYTRLWKTKDGETSSEAYGIPGSMKWCNDNGVSLAWNDETCQQYGEKEINGTLYQIWIEDKQSIEAKLSIMKSSEIAGVAEWKLGLESADVWDAISEYVAN